MLINSDYSRCVVVTPDQYQWTPSPQIGVERVMLDRFGGEKARATSIVRYASGSHFPRHQHPGGEEILVLSGTFSEGDAHYPAGWYMRNPPGSSHQPSSAEGCVIFVKLWQMPETECQRLRIDIRDASRWTTQDDRESCLLFTDQIEHVSIQRLPAGALAFRSLVEGAEIVILEGCLHEGAQQYERGSWIRLPPNQYPDLVAGEDGVTMYLKSGHLSGLAAEIGTPC